MSEVSSLNKSAQRWLWATAAVGILFRLRAFLEGRSLWLDETFLAVNFIDRNLLQLLTLPLENNQSAPPGFLGLSWAAYHLFGQGDFALRVVPLLAACAAPPLAVLVARSILTARLAQAVFVGMVSLSPVLIFYATEFKQYSIDVLATLTVLYWWANWARLRRSPWLVLLGGALAASSLTAVLMLVLLCVVVLTQALIRNRGQQLWHRTFFGEFRPLLIIGWSLAILAHLVQTVITTPVGFMTTWWRDGGAFGPLTTESVDSILWYPASFLKLFFVAFESSAASGPEPLLGSPPVWVAGLLVTAIAVYLRSKWLVLPAITLLAAYWLAQFQLYPLSSRLALYLLPLLFLTLALAVEHSPRLPRPKQLALAAGPLTVLLIIMLGFTGSKVLSPVDYRDTRWALSAIEANVEPGQILAFDPGTRNQITWYLNQGAQLSIAPVSIPWDWEQERFIDVSALQAADQGVWTLTALKREPTEDRLRAQLQQLNFVTVCYVYADVTSVQLDVPAELANSRDWNCQFPAKN